MRDVFSALQIRTHYKNLRNFSSSFTFPLLNLYILGLYPTTFLIILALSCYSSLFLCESILRLCSALNMSLCAELRTPCPRTQCTWIRAAPRGGERAHASGHWNTTMKRFLCLIFVWRRRAAENAAHVDGTCWEIEISEVKMLSACPVFY